MKLKYDYKVEVEKYNIKYGEFLSLCKETCKYKNVPFNFDKERFTYSVESSYTYYDGNKNKTREHLHYAKIVRPYTYIKYVYTRGGVKLIESYNFEFTNKDKKIGNGYFLMCKRNLNVVQK